MTPTGQVGGHDKCPKCGSTDIAYSKKTGQLTCKFCRHAWSEAFAEAALGYDTDIRGLEGVTISRGASNIATDAAEVITLKCQGCGAEVVINSALNVQARCHWCRSVLSLNERVSNGAVPDAVLPFSITHEQAVANVQAFAKKRMFFAHKGFRSEFSPENVVGVYMPYIVADALADIKMQGEGEIQTRRYTVKVGENRSETRYDADVYHVAREFELAVDDATVESSARRLGKAGARDTSNVINAVLPFDTKQAVQYNANYLGGYTSERRDLDVDDLSGAVGRMIFGLGSAMIRPSLRQYGRGVSWKSGAVGVKGVRYMSMAAPIWLYSYYENHGDNNEFLHYIAVNGRTGATMGSVPVNRFKLAMYSLGAALVTFGIGLAVVML
ncbi:hypothetical protein SAMN06309944_1112 [Micrococcales bacterium KH10]|nr:hypothetical protein SAMN06309944_1112 [Micrococcales bacterium KH10]